MRRQFRNVVHCAVLLAVAVQVGFAVAFLLDAHWAETAYSALAAHHVRVPAQTARCGQFLTSTRPNTYKHACLVTYSFQGKKYSDVMPYNQPRAFYIDPLNPSDRMSVGNFAHGPTGRTADIVFASLLLSGAVLVTIVHQMHLRRRRQRLPESST